MRLFLAIPFQPETRASLVRTMNALRKAGVRGNYTLPENLHLTLHFLGELPPSAVNLIEEAVVGCELNDFSLTVEDLGAFEQTGVLWAGIRENEALNALQRDLGKALIRAGFQVEKRPYRPHLTLVREYELPYDFVPPELAPVTQNAQEIVLFESKREAGRLKYVPKFRVPLEDDRIAY